MILRHHPRFLHCAQSVDLWLRDLKLVTMPHACAWCITPANRRDTKCTRDYAPTTPTPDELNCPSGHQSQQRSSPLPQHPDLSPAHPPLFRPRVNWRRPPWTVAVRSCGHDNPPPFLVSRSHDAPPFPSASKSPQADVFSQVSRVAVRSSSLFCESRDSLFFDNSLRIAHALLRLNTSKAGMPLVDLCWSTRRSQRPCWQSTFGRRDIGNGSSVVEQSGQTKPTPRVACSSRPCHASRMLHPLPRRLLRPVRHSHTNDKRRIPCIYRQGFGPSLH